MFRKPPVSVVLAVEEGGERPSPGAARERRCPRAEGGAFPVGRERAGPALHVRAGESDGRLFPAVSRWWTRQDRFPGSPT